MFFTELRLKVIRFIRKYKKVIFIGVLIWGVVFLINLYLKKMPVIKKAETTYKPHVSIMDSSSKAPESVATKAEIQVEDYVKACNNADFDIAFNMLSEDCKKNEFENNLDNFIVYVYSKMPTDKKYAIQDYSNITLDKENIYIYEVKYFDDFLATGLTNQTYTYTTEKIVFKKKKDGTQEMSVGNYIYYEDVKSISENEYLKIDVIDKKVNYSVETYQVKFTNRSDYTVVVADSFVADEVLLKLPGETRSRSDTNQSIVLEPKGSMTVYFTFPKFVDDNEKSESLIFSSIRVLEQYSGENAEEEVLKSEVDNAIAKFGMTVSL